MLFTKTTSSISGSKSYKEGKEIIAQHEGGDAAAFNASRKLYPKGHDTEIKAVNDALGELNRFSAASTAAYGKGAGEDSAKARGERLVPVNILADGSFVSSIDQRKAVLDSTRLHFANNIHSIVTNIQNSGMLGATFDWANYPSRDEILESFQWEYKITALPTAKSLEGLPIDAALADALEADWEKTAKGQARFAQQRLAEDALKFVKNLAERTKELADWAALPEATRGRKPATHETLTTNVHEACQRMRTFAIPDTQEGAALLRLADDIENNLDVDRITAEDLKENIPLARSTASRAFAMAEAIEGMDLFQ
jgi:hypothetical protein